MDISLALSGGGAKGAAHIGVIKALLEEGINIKNISGCSSGSIVAVLYSAGYTPNEILNFFNMYSRYIKDYDKCAVFKFLKGILFCNLKLKGIIKGNNLEHILRKKLKYKGINNIKDFKNNIAIPSVDIRNKKLIYFTNKKILNDECIYINNFDVAVAVRASCSFPGVFYPVNALNTTLVDGGVIENTPSSILRKMGNEKVIAICFKEEEKLPTINNFIDVLVESFETQSKEIKNIKEKDADVLITLSIPNVSLLDIEKSSYIADRGYHLIKNNIEKIKKAII